MSGALDKERLDREIVAMRVAKELPDGAYVNLGIGIPTLVSSFVPEGNVVFYHSESGILNCGPIAQEGEEDIDLINAGGQFPRTGARDVVLQHRRRLRDDPGEGTWTLPCWAPTRFQPRVT